MNKPENTPIEQILNSKDVEARETFPTFENCTGKTCSDEKKKEIWPSPMTKPPIPTENSKTKGQHTNATKNFDYTTIADRLRTVSWSNKSSNCCG